LALSLVRISWVVGIVGCLDGGLVGTVILRLPSSLGEVSTCH
jgi:hypothetical protein